LISGTGRSLKNLMDQIEADTLDVEIRLVLASKASASARASSASEKA
jgi:folate-dependent phosphoribosylglycinamide formyltransferase PurN